MSKCQINKYKAGGRCGGSGSGGRSDAPSSLQSPLAAMMAARDAQDRMLSGNCVKGDCSETPPAPLKANHQLAIRPVAADKKSYIDIIMDGDY
jgi:hypothetical protein